MCHLELSIHADLPMSVRIKKACFIPSRPTSSLLYPRENTRFRVIVKKFFQTSLRKHVRPP